MYYSPFKQIANARLGHSKYLHSMENAAHGSLIRDVTVQLALLRAVSSSSARQLRRTHEFLTDHQARPNPLLERTDPFEYIFQRKGCSNLAHPLWQCDARAFPTAWSYHRTDV
jgi:hypothetical protein